MAWPAAQPWCWRQRIRYVTLDMSTTYAKVAREALPHAQIVIDPFHVTAAANRMVDEVRRRVTRDRRGRRGRRHDREWQLRRRLLRGAEHLTDAQQSELLTSLHRVDPDDQIFAAWIAKELLRGVLACAAVDDLAARRRALREASRCSTGSPPTPLFPRSTPSQPLSTPVSSR
ncbi:transposase [Tsukamurella soli]|uniref:transposase n=1 Tax=Tsukamurella soli TaxID=644556 RepID=UPI0031E80C18